jgi:ribosomal protein S18 acetylase RimI-like enzyme
MPNGMNDWNVERASESDSGEISKLYKTIWTPYNNVFPLDLIANRMPSAREIQTAMEKKVFFMVRNGARIIGVVRGTLEHGACLLDRMVVQPEHQGKGVGKALTQHVIDYARAKKCHKVWLDTSPILKDAVGLYEKMGFRECGSFKKHYWGTDIKFYELIL